MIKVLVVNKVGSKIRDYDCVDDKGQRVALNKEQLTQFIKNKQVVNARMQLYQGNVIIRLGADVSTKVYDKMGSLVGAKQGDKSVPVSNLRQTSQNIKPQPQAPVHPAQTQVPVQPQVQAQPILTKEDKIYKKIQSLYSKYFKLNVDNGKLVLERCRFNQTVVSIPFGVSEVKANCFAGNTDIKVIAVPLLCVSFEPGAFADLPKLERIVVSETSQGLEAIKRVAPDNVKVVTYLGEEAKASDNEEDIESKLKELKERLRREVIDGLNEASAKGINNSSVVKKAILTTEYELMKQIVSLAENTKYKEAYNKEVIMKYAEDIIDSKEKKLEEIRGLKGEILEQVKDLEKDESLTSKPIPMNLVEAWYKDKIRNQYITVLTEAKKSEPVISDSDLELNKLSEAALEEAMKGVLEEINKRIEAKLESQRMSEQLEAPDTNGFEGFGEAEATSVNGFEGFGEAEATSVNGFEGFGEATDTNGFEGFGEGETLDFGGETTSTDGFGGFGEGETLDFGGETTSTDGFSNTTDNMMDNIFGEAVEEVVNPDGTSLDEIFGSDSITFSQVVDNEEEDKFSL